jgi:Ankyrin repeats (3 copies)
MASRLNASAAVWTPSVNAAPAVQLEGSRVDYKQKKFPPRTKRPRQSNTERIIVSPDISTATDHADAAAVASDTATGVHKSRTRRNFRQVQQRQQQQQQQRLHASADDVADVHKARLRNTRKKQQSKSNRLQAALIADGKAVTDESVTASVEQTTGTHLSDSNVLAEDAFPALPSAAAGKPAAIAAVAVNYTALVDKLAAEQQRHLSLALVSVSADSSSTTVVDGVKLSLLEHKKRSLLLSTVDASSSTESTDECMIADTVISMNNNVTDATAAASCATAGQTVSIAARPSTELKERWRERWFTLESQRIAALQRQKLELQLMALEDKLPETVATAASVTNTIKHLHKANYMSSSSSSATVNDSWHTRLRPTHSTRQSLLTAHCTVTASTHSAATIAAAISADDDNSSSSSSSSSTSSSLHITAAVMQSPVSPVDWFDAVRSNNVQAVIAMLNTGTIAWDIRDDTTHCMTAMHIAAQCGHASVLQALLNTATVAGTSVKDRSKATPLHYAVQVDSSSNMHNMNADMQHQQLHLQLQCVQILLKHGARCDTKDKNGMTVLHIAAANGFTEAVGTILSNGRHKINTRNKHGATALQCAIEHSCAHSTSGHGDDEHGDNIAAVCSLLLSAGAAVDIPNDHGMTAICTAAVYGATELLMMLLSAQQAKPSHTHQHQLARHSNTAVNSNANANVNSVRGKANSNAVVSQQPGINMSLSALHEAAAAGQTEAVKILINVSKSITII